nr:collagen alpha-1(I) chain-like isoform X2 [Ovis aries]
MSWLVGGRDRESDTGGRLRGVKTGESRHMVVEDPMPEEPGAAGKAGLASSVAGPHARGWEGPPPAAFVRGPQTGFCWKPGSQATPGAGARLPVAPAAPGAGAEAGAEGPGGRADRPALPDPGEKAQVFGGDSETQLRGWGQPQRLPLPARQQRKPASSRPGTVRRRGAVLPGARGAPQCGGRHGGDLLLAPATHSDCAPCGRRAAAPRGDASAQHRLPLMALPAEGATPGMRVLSSPLGLEPCRGSCCLNHQTSMEVSCLTYLGCNFCFDHSKM